MRGFARSAAFSCFALLVAACGDSTSQPGVGPCEFGSAVAAITRSPTPEAGDFAYNGPATPTSTDPFALAFADQTLTFTGFPAPPQPNSALNLSFTSHCTTFCDFSAVVTDAEGLLFVAWDTTSMETVESPGFTLTAEDDACATITGDPTVPQIASITLTVASATEVVPVAAGERATIGSFTVTNGQSTVNSHRVTVDLPDRLFRGNILRQ